RPYVNPNRIASGGLEKKKLSPEELDRKMAEMRIKNAELLRKKEASAADERAFLETQKEIKKKEEEDRRRRREELTMKKEKEEKAKAAFDALTREREENAQRKLQAKAGREWDMGKEGKQPAAGGAMSTYQRAGNSSSGASRTGATSTITRGPVRKAPSRDGPVVAKPEAKAAPVSNGTAAVAAEHPAAST
ncbi:hypothetical protein HK101_008512, partial [Irineochytrium annulatum]